MIHIRVNERNKNLLLTRQNSLLFFKILVIISLTLANIQKTDALAIQSVSCILFQEEEEEEPLFIPRCINSFFKHFNS